MSSLAPLSLSDPGFLVGVRVRDGMIIRLITLRLVERMTAGPEPRGVTDHELNEAFYALMKRKHALVSLHDPLYFSMSIGESPSYLALFDYWVRCGFFNRQSQVEVIPRSDSRYKLSAYGKRLLDQHREEMRCHLPRAVLDILEM